MYLYGASGHAKVIIEIIELLSLDIHAIIDDNPDIHSLLGYEVLHQTPNLLENIFISIGNNSIRKKIHLNYSDSKFSTLIHPRTSISKRAEIGEGTVVMAGVSVNCDATIGQQVILNTNCSIDHDCRIGDYAHISPNAALAGNVSIGEGTHVGIGASVIQGITIGKWCTIGAGTVIINNIPDNCTVVGNPGKIIKTK